ncbi:MAG: hypothetical protein R3E84_04085 [Pseudomonadales bacterium]
MENNIVWDDPSGDWNEQEGFSAVAFGAEDYKAKGSDTINNIVRNNLFAGYRHCIWAAQFPKSRSAGLRMGFHAYGNTCVAQNGLVVFLSPSLGAGNVDEIVIENNVFHANPPTADGLCRSLKANGIRFSHNAWSEAPKDDFCTSRDDVNGDPGLLTSLDAFSRMDYRRPPVEADFGLSTYSPIIGAGNILADWRVLPAGQFLNQQIEGQKGCEFSTTALSLDYHCRQRANPPTIGALELANYPPNPPVVWLEEAP